MTFISDTFNFIGRALGETAHQADSALSATWDLTKDIAEDISNIPSAIADGYDQELFESSESAPEPEQLIEPK